LKDIILLTVTFNEYITGLGSLRYFRRLQWQRVWPRKSQHCWWTIVESYRILWRPSMQRRTPCSRTCTHRYILFTVLLQPGTHLWAYCVMHIRACCYDLSKSM